MLKVTNKLAVDLIEEPLTITSLNVMLKLEAIEVPSGSIITMKKDKKEYLNTSMFRDIEWFRPPGFKGLDSDSYGTFTGIYEIKRKVTLLNLGDKRTRQVIEKVTGLNLNPDNQYQGHESNLLVHKAILESKSFDKFDGTIITSVHIKEEDLDELEGPEEIVLFTQRKIPLQLKNV